MPIASESDRDIIRPKHHKVVPGLGVFIAPKAVARLFQLHGYSDKKYLRLLNKERAYEI